MNRLQASRAHWVVQLVILFIRCVARACACAVLVCGERGVSAVWLHMLGCSRCPPSKSFCMIALEGPMQPPPEVPVRIIQAGRIRHRVELSLGPVAVVDVSFIKHSIRKKSRLLVHAMVGHVHTCARTWTTAGRRAVRLVSSWERIRKWIVGGWHGALAWGDLRAGEFRTAAPFLFQCRTRWQSISAN